MADTRRQCASLEEVRAEIDRIDRGIVVALGERASYVRQAAAFKTSLEGVRAPDRLASMLAQRRVWAQEEGLDPELIERVYRELVAYFIAEEAHHWRTMP